jgi:alginate O-acetyltransferase complex protein AlgI
VLLAIYAFAFGLYLDFAGYSDIAIGLALCAGVQVPENFDAPYLAKNISLLWQRWHMSLTSWLRDFVFLPATRRLLRWTRRPLLSQVAGQLVTMLLCGLWHGLAWHYAAWGVYNGLGLAGLSAWRAWRGPAPAGSLGRDALATVATFHFFAAGLVLFACDVTQAGHVGARLLDLFGE